AAIQVNSLAATHFLVSAPSSSAAGNSFTYTITAQDAFNNTATAYSGTVHFSSNDPQAVLPANATLVNGIATFTATLKTAGSESLTATDTVSSSVAGTAAIQVSPTAATHFAVSAPANSAAGSSFNFTVTALDTFGNTATAYSGTVQFASNDGQAALPASATLTAGAGTFTVTLRTAGTDTLSASDTAAGSIAGSATVQVSALATTHLVVAVASNVTAGVNLPFTVTAEDQFGNVAPTYGGLVHFSSTDLSASLPTDLSLSSGVGSFNATLRTVGIQALTATDTVTSSIAGSGSIRVNPATATHFLVAAPSSTTAGTAVNVTITALDAFGNAATGYTGIVHFTSTDGQAVLPSDTTLSGGTGTFSVGLRTAGSQTLSVKDTANATITGSAAVSVNAAAATHFTVTPPASANAGSGFVFTVTALDPFGNTATGHAGTVHFASTDSLAAVPANMTLASGVGTFSATLKTAGTQAITASDTVTSSIAGIGTLQVNPLGATHFTVSAPTSFGASGTFAFAVTAQDVFGNTATGYTGTVHFSSSDATA